MDNWVIVRDDEAANRIIENKNLAKSISGCITLSGTRHTLGSIIIGNNNNSNDKNNNNINSNNNNNNNNNNRVILQLEHQIKYKKLKNQYLKNFKLLRETEMIIEEENEYNHNASQLIKIHENIVTLDNLIIELSNSLILQQEKAEIAHR